MLGQQHPELLILKFFKPLCNSVLPTPATGQCLPLPPPQLLCLWWAGTGSRGTDTDHEPGMWSHWHRGSSAWSRLPHGVVLGQPQNNTVGAGVDPAGHCCAYTGVPWGRQPGNKPSWPYNMHTEAGGADGHKQRSSSSAVVAQAPSATQTLHLSHSSTSGSQLGSVQLTARPCQMAV